MADEFTNSIMGGGRYASLSAESLELMGKQAANRYMSEDVPLNETIAKLAAEHNDINGEQVRRICEFANTAVYLAKHDQNKTAGVNSSYPQFELADPARIIQDMSDGARSTITTDVDLAYSKHPLKQKTASALVDELKDTVIERVFGTNPEKPEVSRNTVVHELVSARTTLEGMDEELHVRKQASQNILDESREEFYKIAKQHVMDGNSFAEIIQAAQSTGLGTEKVSGILQPVIYRLMSEKIATAATLSKAAGELSKIAHRVVNPEHPLVRAVMLVSQTSEDVEKTSSARKEVQEQYQKVDTFIRENFIAGSTR